jgi:plasmid stability protein
MPAITVKNIPEDLYRRLKRVARANRRSINNEIIICLERQLRSGTIDPETLLARARKLREKTAVHPIRDREFSEAKEAGRP